MSVRGITEQVLRCGDIDGRYTDPSAMLDGAKAHRRIQKAMGKGYRKEVSLRIETEADGIPVLLQGRADGVMEENGGLTIDEIKTTTLPLDKFYEQRELHLGQAKCYAHMLLEEMKSPPETVTIQLTYFQLDTEDIQRYRFDFTRKEIAAFFQDLLERYAVWLHFERDWRTFRDASIQATGFPFATYRKGQRELAVATYRTIERAGKLYVQAPTGIGKTLSALFPSVKAVGEGKAGKLFYLTAKTVTRAVAEDAVRLMAGKGLRLKSLTLRAKEKICFLDKPACNPDQCEFARGHYDRVGDAVLDILEHNDLIVPETVADYSRKHRVCPHETALDTALWADLVICDYNHVFDPVACLKRFFSVESEDSNYVFLIDEAHNLVDRVRDMYTETLRKSDFLKLKRKLKDKRREAVLLHGAMEKINKYLLACRKEIEPEKYRVTKEQDDELAGLAFRFLAATEAWLAAEKDNVHPLQKELTEFYFQTASFTGISSLYDEHFDTITEVSGSDVAVTLYCLDPSRIIADKLKLAKSSILFSATLTPLPYYREILGGDDGDRMLALPSPFDRDKLLLAAHCGISTRYADRPDSISPIAEAIALAVSAKRGNYMVYFPSYEYMKQVYEVFVGLYPHIETLVQQGGMGEEERARFLGRFDAGNRETLIGFCVLGGIFSEGIDLTGERLIGSVIVGVGLPKINLRQDLIRDYFDEKNGAGYDYAYVFPGMNKVLQAAGRVIRTEEDTGLVLLIDSRFATAKYRRLYPTHWDGLRILRETDELRGFIGKFHPFQTK